MAFLVRRYIKFIKDDKARHESEIIVALETKMDEQRKGMQAQMRECYNDLVNVVKASEERSFAEDEHIHEEIDAIKGGLLSLEGRNFKEDCRRLLMPGHIITLAEYEAIQAEHIVYNNLGGNHEGDGLYSMVMTKYQNTLNTNNEEGI